MSARYRVSAKALIINQDGDVLLVKERHNDWDLPGGGIDYGETPQQALERELHEEIGQRLEVLGEPSRTVTFYHESMDTWVMWIIFKLSFADIDEVGPGRDVSEVRFVPEDKLECDGACEERVIADILSKQLT